MKKMRMRMKREKKTKSHKEFRLETRDSEEYGSLGVELELWNP